MSRVGDSDYDQEYNNQGDLWWANVRRALGGKRGRKALAELREALIHLPEKRLIEGALGRIEYVDNEAGPEVAAVAPGQVGCFDEPGPEEFTQTVRLPGGQKASGSVCAVGAFIWWKRIKAGEEPERVLNDLDGKAEDDLWETAYAGQRAGLAYTLAWALAYRNDEEYGGISDEERYARTLNWVDRQLAAPLGRALV